MFNIFGWHCHRERCVFGMFSARIRFIHHSQTDRQSWYLHRGMWKSLLQVHTNLLHLTHCILFNRNCRTPTGMQHCYVTHARAPIRCRPTNWMPIQSVRYVAVTASNSIVAVRPLKTITMLHCSWPVHRKMFAKPIEPIRRLSSNGCRPTQIRFWNNILSEQPYYIRTQCMLCHHHHIGFSKKKTHK